MTTFPVGAGVKIVRPGHDLDGRVGTVDRVETFTRHSGEVVESVWVYMGFGMSTSFRPHELERIEP